MPQPALLRRITMHYPANHLTFGASACAGRCRHPITSVFLIAKALHFTDTVTASVLSATFLMCGLGAILQSTGVKGVGARLPFIMVPGARRLRFSLRSLYRPISRPRLAP